MALARTKLDFLYRDVLREVFALVDRLDAVQAAISSATDQAVGITNQLAVSRKYTRRIIAARPQRPCDHDRVGRRHCVVFFELQRLLDRKLS